MSGGSKPKEAWTGSINYSAACTIPSSPQEIKIRHDYWGTFDAWGADDAPCRVAVPVPVLATLLSSHSHSSARVDRRQQAARTLHAQLSGNKVTEAAVSVSMQKLTGMAGRRQSDDEHVT